MKKHKPEQIVALLRQAEAEIANIKITGNRDQVQTYDCWRKEFSG